MGRSEMKRKRPLRITLIGVLSIIIGLVDLFPLPGFPGLGDLVKMTNLTFHNGPLALTAFGLAIANFILGVGCLYGWRPIWFYLLIVSVANFAVATIALLNTDVGSWQAMLIDAVWFVLAVFVLLSGFSRGTRKWFRIDRRIFGW